MIRAIVTDIEGTTSSLSFVKEVLFPYAREHMAGFVRVHAADPNVARLIDDVRQLIGSDATLAQVIDQLVQWIDEDRKITPLKELQGLIWEQGYRADHLHGHIYPDAEQALRQWRRRGIALYVYSSGSVHAQKLLFAHTPYGDLTPLFKGYFDTRIGAKTERQSYEKIAAAVQSRPDRIFFLSDTGKELDAANAAGMHTRWLVRDGEPEPGAAHRQVRNFAEIPI